LDDKRKHVFHKGNNNISQVDGLNKPNNAPGLYIQKIDNQVKLQVFMSTYSTIDETITIPNIPLNKWINVVIRCQNLKVDVYINGLIAQSYQLTNVPKQNYYDVFVCDQGGFDGSLSDLRYYASALDIFSISAIVSRGPKLKPSTSPAVGDSNAANSGPKGSSYLSSSWYTARV
jgi:hypothetical protein